MNGKKAKKLKRFVRNLIVNGREPRNEAENKVLEAALNAPPLMARVKHEDQTDVPKGQVRYKLVQVGKPSPIRYAQRTALRKLDKKEQAEVLAA